MEWVAVVSHKSETRAKLYYDDEGHDEERSSVTAQAVISIHQPPHSDRGFTGRRRATNRDLSIGCVVVFRSEVGKTATDSQGCLVGT